jgi:hypothetical protein
MRSIKVPADIDQDKVKLSFRDAMTEAIQNFPESGKGIKNIRTANKLCDKIDASKEVIELDDADYEFLVKAVNELGWNPRLVKVLIPFMDALENAEKK